MIFILILKTRVYKKKNETNSLIIFISDWFINMGLNLFLDQNAIL